MPCVVCDVTQEKLRVLIEGEMNMTSKAAIELQVECIQDSIKDITTELSDLLEMIQTIEVDENE